jgi:cobalamin 5'-phosphate synthase/cobalamin synthase
VKSLVVAVAFLTRFPVGNLVSCDASDVARSAGWFPLVGVLLGLIYAGVAALCKDHLPLVVVAVLLVMLDALLTGALHYDGLADTLDGFGGGKDRDDVLRIMRDHNIGSFGGVALVVLVALKATAYAALLGRSGWIAPVVLIPALGRWSILLLAAMLPYARPSESVVRGMGERSLLLGSVVVIIGLIAAASLRAWMAVGVIIAVTFLFGRFCRRRIGGITGDTLGANLQIGECAALLVFLWTAHAQ